MRAFDPSECRGRSPIKLAEKRKSWPATKVRRELEAFITEREYFPTCETFQVAGRLDLYDQVQLNGGTARWARELKIRHRPYERELGGATHERIRAELTSYLRGKRRWPTVREFNADGRGPLRAALRRCGGAPYWAAEFGLQGRPGTCSAKLLWTVERIDEALADLLIGRTRWPRQRDFAEAGRGGMLSAMYRCRGTRYWARRVGFTHDTAATQMVRDTPYRRPPVLPVDPAPWEPPAAPGATGWTPAMIVDAIHRWTDEHGRTPRAADWSPDVSKFSDAYYAAPHPPTSLVTCARCQNSPQPTGLDAPYHTRCVRNVSETKRP